MQPLIDLHVHLPGTVRATTLQELADKNGVHLPMPAVELYKRINSDPTEEEQGKGPWFPLLRIYELICDSLQTRDDFARVVYEALEDGLTTAASSTASWHSARRSTCRQASSIGTWPPAFPTGSLARGLSSAWTAELLGP